MPLDGAWDAAYLKDRPYPGEEAKSSSVRFFGPIDAVADHVGLSVQALLVEALARSSGS